MELRLVFNEDDADENPSLLRYISETFKNKEPFFEYKKLNFFGCLPLQLDRSLDEKGRTIFSCKLDLEYFDIK